MSALWYKTEGGEVMDASIRYEDSSMGDIDMFDSPKKEVCSDPVSSFTVTWPYRTDESCVTEVLQNGVGVSVDFTRAKHTWMPFLKVRIRQWTMQIGWLY